MSCNGGQKSERTTRTLTLINNIGTVTLDLTADFDTLHSWKRNEDYKCGAQQYYRFQSMKYSMAEETQPFSHEPDSMLQLTITHYYYSECIDERPKKFEPDSILKNIPYFYLLMNPKHKKEFKIFEKTNINGLPFVVHATADSSYYKKTIIQKLSAITFFNTYVLSFDFEKSSPTFNDTAFIRDSYEMLKTIKIK